MLTVCGLHYCLAVTDPLAESKYLVAQNGTYQVQDAVVCVSLAEPFHGFAYKLVASIITPEQGA
jgi:hypothetical protein